MRVEYDDRGRRDFVYAPCHVVKFTKTEDEDGVLTIVHVEVEPGDDLEFQSLPKSLRQLLGLDGPRDPVQTEQILTQWRQLEVEPAEDETVAA